MRKVHFLSENEIRERKFAALKSRWEEQAMIRYVGQEAKATSRWKHTAPLVESLVWNSLQDLRNKLEEAGDMQRGNFIKCGSFYDGTKVGCTDEFDYTYEWTPPCIGSLKPVHVDSERFRPQTNPKSKHRSYYELRLTEQEGFEDNPLITKHRFLSPRLVQEEFEKVLAKLLPDRPAIQPKGPAVSFFITPIDSFFDGKDLNLLGKVELKRLEGLLEQRPVKVDIAIGIPFERDKSQDKWPLDNVDLADHLTAESIRKCHLVPAGNYWRLSFAEWEMEKMATLPEAAKNVLITIKRLRDEAKRTGVHEPAILSTYPIKVAFFKEVDMVKAGSGDWEQEGPRMFRNILRMLEEEAFNMTMTGYFIKDDQLFMDPNQINLEVDRMNRKAADKISDMNASFVDKKIFLILGVIISGLAIFRKGFTEEAVSDILSSLFIIFLIIAFFDVLEKRFTWHYRRRLRHFCIRVPSALLAVAKRALFHLYADIDRWNGQNGFNQWYT